MNILKISCFSIIILGFISIGCNKDIDSLEYIQVIENKSMDTEENLRKKRPCYPTGGQVLPHITTQGQCSQYGFFWVRGKCWACY